MENNKLKEKSALKVTPGVEQPSQVNHNNLQGVRQRRRNISAATFVEGIKRGDRTILSRAITLIESTLPAHQKIAQEVIDQCLPFSGNSYRIGISGVPGVGKSTFIETLGTYITHIGRKLTVLAIDPSSERSHGSILGDKTRMEQLATNKNAFIRPSPAGGALGGVARKTRETIVLCEAAGFDTILIETVGVGQSEITVNSMVDFFVLLMLAGAGDELQGIKRGIMEIADLIAITKADGENKRKALVAKKEYQNALHLFPPAESGWKPEVITCSALENQGIADLWQFIDRFFSTKNHFIKSQRQKQAKHWMYETINHNLQSAFYSDETIKQLLNKLEKKVASEQISPFEAAKQLIDTYKR